MTIRYCIISPLSSQTSLLHSPALSTRIACRSTYIKVSILHIIIPLFARVELFFDSCEEMKAWIQEKDAVLSDGDLGRDLETVRALQRRHQVQEYQPEG